MDSYYSFYCSAESSSNPGGNYDASGGTNDRPNRPGFAQMEAPLKKSKLSVWGNHNYQFNFRQQGESLYQTSILFAEATNIDDIPLPIRC